MPGAGNLRHVDAAYLDGQALAYTITEQGRALCERLLQDAHGDALRRLLAAHRGLGMAGFVATEGMDSARRRELFTRVLEEGPAGMDVAHDDERALLFAVHGSAAIARCFEVPELLGPMQIAHRHCRAAQTALTALVGFPRATTLIRAETGAGHLSREWQTEHLRPGHAMPVRHPAWAEDLLNRAA